MSIVRAVTFIFGFEVVPPVNVFVPFCICVWSVSEPIVWKILYKFVFPEIIVLPLIVVADKTPTLTWPVNVAPERFDFVSILFCKPPKIVLTSVLPE